MKLRFIAVLSSLTLFVFGTQSCSHINRATNISSYGDTESHNEGRNCMECHKNGGEGEGAFSVAGTVYKKNSSATYPNATVKLYTGQNATGDLKATIEVDGLGNFYTTEFVDFSAPLFPSVTGTETEHMTEALVLGQCNSCHGVTEDKISVK